MFSVGMVLRRETQEDRCWWIRILQKDVEHSIARQGAMKEMGDCKVVSEGTVARLYQMAVCRDIKKTKRVKAEART